MKNTTILISIVLIIAVIGSFLYINSGYASSNGNAAENVNTETTETQKITLSYKNGNYYPNTITAKANEPVEITLGSSVKGCYRSFTISALNVRKYLATPSDSVTFTPAQKGTYRFACSMGMGTGTLIVE